MSSTVPIAPVTPDAVAPAGRTEREHRYDVDLIRLLASVGVILCHSGSAFLDAVGRTEAGGSGVYWAGIVGDSASRFAVPVFFAIAGWVILVGAPPKDGRRLRQRIVRILVPLGAWTVIYLAWGRWRGTNDGPVGELARDALFGSVRPAFHLWYLYAYVPVILLLAFVVMVKSGKRPWGLGAALLALALAPVFLGDVGRLTGWDMPRLGWTFSPYQLVYAVAGALLVALPAGAAGRWRAPWALLAAAGFAGVVWYQHDVHYAIPYGSLFVALFTGGVLLSLHRLRIPGRLRPHLVVLGNASFGAYLVHLLVLTALSRWFVSEDLGPAAAAAALAGLVAATTLLSFGAALLWGRLGLNRLLG
ncbi:acyltransferase [Streptomyces sp. NBC_00234]|uniref:acyltransferase n=1 Tax=Streptomyces sp. NBC_00234 TaxID=2903638 RepID=UPI002E2BB7AF|nr:acyltransferase [Streptomyces sp. NBC_00234]